MNAFGHPMLWCAVQVTVLGLAALGIDIVIGRRRPAAGALVTATALVAVVLLTAIAFSPWPSWAITWNQMFFGHQVPAQRSVAADADPDGEPSLAADRGHLESGNHDLSAIGPVETAEPTDALFARSSAVLAGNWMVIAAIAYCIGVGLMAIRIGVGLTAARGYRRNSRPITDRSLLELVDIVCAEIGCRYDIDLRETDRLNTPATIGSRRPILLLPVDWPTWTEDERHAALAHEIEHVRRRDFLLWIAAQFGLLLHFYNPVVHWLAARLRLHQELAADAAAARVLGGQRKYVTTLAAMALRQSDSFVAWPTCALLPTSKTFLRRIEMLHRSQSLRCEVSRTLFVVSVAAVCVATICAAGFRDKTTVAADGPQAAQPGTRPKILDATSNPSPEQMRLSLNNVKRLALAFFAYETRHQHFPPAYVIGPDGKTPHSWRVELLPYLDEEKLFAQYRMGEPWDGPHNKQLIDKIPAVLRSPFDDPNSKSSGYYVFVGPGTVFDGTKGSRFRDITDGASNTFLLIESKRNIPWTKPEDIPFDRKKGASITDLGGFFKDAFSAALADGSAHAFVTDAIKDQLDWLIMRADGHPIDWNSIHAGLPPAAARNPRRELSAEEAASRYHLKAIARAMHNYHRQHGRFPPATVMGPDGKTPHSWRVELLPYLEQAELYKQYRQNEPWDSPANKEVLKFMPDAYRSPYDDVETFNSAYYVFVGPGTVFEGTKGIKEQDITDGTSNTLFVTESKRNIPWTKPEDIPFDPEKPLPNIGGFVEGSFVASNADGTVRRFDMNQVKDKLKWMIMRNDGHIFERAWP